VKTAIGIGESEGSEKRELEREKPNKKTSGLKT
jgi:hypothetical protein